ncbi:Tn3 transposase DDE domain protein [Photorhabdus namnaonensis]|uniref:Tn3 transposase DDE domain protein n=1 Tax=Photorhabdus namnaonensis TaxID=1851568 RepID=A0A1B8YBD3_9GAMM|nr:Tn3 transposase DDE domain protein [Photorhabdus namnaonensis]
MGNQSKENDRFLYSYRGIILPADFLNAEQRASYGQFSGEPNEVQLARFFLLDKADMDFINNRRGRTNRLAVALLIGCVRFLGTWPHELSLIPTNIQWFVARQLGISDIGVLSEYSRRETTLREHQALIRRRYGYHDFTWPWTFRLSRLLFTRSWLSNERPGLLFDLATSWLLQNKILLPGVTTLTRLISEIREKSATKLWTRLSSMVSEAQRLRLEELLRVPDGVRTSYFDQLRKGPVVISGPAFNQAVTRYLKLKAYGMQDLDFTSIPPVRFNALARYAGLISVYKIARMPSDRRTAMLIAFVRSYEISALDDALDVLDGVITNIGQEAKKIGQKKRLRTLKDLDRSALELANICSVLLDENIDSELLRSTIFRKYPPARLADTITFINAIARPADTNFHDEMVEQYGRVRRFLPCMLENIVFSAAPAGEITLEALHYLTAIQSTRKLHIDDAPIAIITGPWKRLCYGKDGHISRQGYTLCAINKLQDSLRRRDIFVQQSEQWGDPRAKLLQGQDWYANRVQIYRSLGHPLNAVEAVSALTRQLDTVYRQVAKNFSDNKAVSLDFSGKRTKLTIAHLSGLDESPALKSLTERVSGLLPVVDLTELLLEINAHTGFIDEFSHASEADARMEGLTVSICAVLLAEACNIGIEPFIRPNIPALTRHRLNWTRQNYLRAETLASANARLVDYQSTLLLAQKWGGGEVASADGMRFIVPVRTVHAGPNRKYFGSGRGITWYNFVSDQYSGFHGIVVPGTLRDSIFVLEGLLEQQTGLNPREIMTDTAGSSDLIFGLFWLLGYQFSPRLADAGASVFWRVDKDVDYGVLNDLARSIANTRKIEQHWDDMMRMAGSLTMGKIRTSVAIRSLLKSDRPSGLTQAIIEAGKINKTLYLLNYIDDEDYRRRILTQLNRGESRHAVARAICHGQKGEIRKRYQDGQEDQLGALGLVTNAVVLWNTIYMQAALDHLRNEGETINEEDEARLSPLKHAHINMLGHYTFTLAEQVTKGQLRPLKQPEETDEWVQ